MRLVRKGVVGLLFATAAVLAAGAAHADTMVVVTSQMVSCVQQAGIESPQLSLTNVGRTVTVSELLYEQLTAKGCLA
ncbi:hypothetical protein D5S18_20875 [Nocardia panacis]|uniref:Uncharacterized protein n=1 Tax=Nocardia panacis TaxID=2340916 RepID=A0A3A4KH95_9NOCA|nr:hypothetical protein [Nocardia panacis]RJO73638.1 hypothetical protein D5S18_20875 [Nocardia panacis]